MTIRGSAPRCCSLVLHDTPTVTLAAFVIANTLHTVNHGVDVQIGGEPAAVCGGSARSA